MGGYRYHGDPEWPWPPGDPRWNFGPGQPQPAPDPVLSPRDIVRQLHREIAAKSPAHAALVASFEAGWITSVPRGSGHVQTQKQAWAARIRDYAALRAEGASREEAARAVGVTEKTAQQYDSDIRHGRIPAVREAA